MLTMKVDDKIIAEALEQLFSRIEERLAETSAGTQTEIESFINAEELPICYQKILANKADLITTLSYYAPGGVNNYKDTFNINLLTGEIRNFVVCLDRIKNEFLLIFNADRIVFNTDGVKKGMINWRIDAKHFTRMAAMYHEENGVGEMVEFSRADVIYADMLAKKKPQWFQGLIEGYFLPTRKHKISLTLYSQYRTHTLESFLEFFREKYQDSPTDPYITKAYIKYKLMLDLLRVVSVIHNEKLAHGDLKPTNIFVLTNERHEYQGIMPFDFEYTQRTDDQDQIPKTAVEHVSPEIIQVFRKEKASQKRVSCVNDLRTEKFQYFQNFYTRKFEYVSLGIILDLTKPDRSLPRCWDHSKHDMWSVGVILLEIEQERRIIFCAKNKVEIQKELDYIKGHPFFSQILTLDPASRLSATEAISLFQKVFDEKEKAEISEISLQKTMTPQFNQIKSQSVEPSSQKSPLLSKVSKAKKLSLSKLTLSNSNFYS